MKTENAVIQKVFTFGTRSKTGFYKLSYIMIYNMIKSNHSMKQTTSLLVIAVFLGITISVNAQTLYVPGGTVGNITGTNVGIGTNAPLDFLHIEKWINGEVNIRVTNTYTNGARTFLTAAPGLSSVQTDKDFAIQTNGGGWTPKLYVTNAGKVGIGTTTPGTNLEVKGSLSSTTSLRIGNANNSMQFDYVNNGAGIDRLDLNPGAGGAKVTFLNSGNVGINNPSPAQNYR